MAKKKVSPVSKEKKQRDPTKLVKQEKVAFDIPDLLGMVDFQCSNIARLSANNADVRIAFGDLGPTGKLTPRAGLALSPIVAKSLHKALSNQLSRIESEYGPIPDSPVEIKISVTEVEEDKE